MTLWQYSSYAIVCSHNQGGHSSGNDTNHSRSPGVRLTFKAARNMWLQRVMLVQKAFTESHREVSVLISRKVCTESHWKVSVLIVQKACTADSNLWPMDQSFHTQSVKTWRLDVQSCAEHRVTSLRKTLYLRCFFLPRSLTGICEDWRENLTDQICLAFWQPGCRFSKVDS